MNSTPFNLLMPTASLGRVSLLPSQFELNASTTEQSFRSSAAGATSTGWVSNPPHASYRLQQAYFLDGHEFWVVGWFSFARLVAVELSLKTVDDADADWSKWDAARVQAAHQVQVDLLVGRYGSHPVMFNWGAIRSDHDPRGGGASITIRFTPSQGFSAK